ncbi:MAG: hypothetical protein ABI233_00375, partial [Chthoniobacterales bacterium]
MTTSSLLRSLLLSICFCTLAAPGFAQEDEIAPIASPPPAHNLATPSAATLPNASPSPANQLSVASPTPSASPTPVQLTDLLFKNLKARAIGPAVMGGRVSDLALDPRNPAIFYVGLATGGVFKTSDNGVTFSPIFDKQSSL